jgi:hypothetical protein
MNKIFYVFLIGVFFCLTFYIAGQDPAAADKTGGPPAVVNDFQAEKQGANMRPGSVQGGEGLNWLSQSLSGEAFLPDCESDVTEGVDHILDGI